MNPRSSNPLSLVSRYWFPVALIVILLLALPGFILFLLNLVGLEGPVNRYLQDNFHFTYSIPIPWWGALALLLVPLLILLLYFLKLKRRPLAVPSTFLWKKSIEDLHVNSFFQWLRQNVLLLLALLAVTAMIFSIMGFRFHGRVGRGKHYIIMIDNSASMSATDLGESRLEWAKREALKEIDAGGDGDFGMVIEFNSRAEIKQSYTSDKGYLRAAVHEIKETQRTTRIDEALNLADSLANPSRSTDDQAVQPPGAQGDPIRQLVPAEGIATEVHLFSDGRFPDVPNFSMGKLSIQYHMAGKSGAENTDNVALVTLSAVRNESDPTKVDIFTRALNFRSQAVNTKIVLEVWVDGQRRDVHEKPLLLDARKVPMKATEKDESADRDTPGEASVPFSLRDLDDRATTMVHARIVDVKDRFPLDDEGWLIVGVVRKARVLIVGPTNEVLEAFFNDTATADVADVKFVGADYLETKEYLKLADDSANESYDLVIFDRCGPSQVEQMPHCNTFFIGYPPPPWRLKPLGNESDEKYVVEPVKFPHVKGWDARHVVLRFLTTLQEVGIAEAFRMKDLPPRTPRLMESDLNTTILLTLSRHSYTDLVMTFPLITEKDEWNTNWPLKPSFPLFLRNVLYSLGNVSDAAGEETVQPGQIKVLRPDSSVKSIRVIGPDGTRYEPLMRNTRSDFFSFGATDKVGVYKVIWENERQRSFAVNLLDSEESNIEPRPEVIITEDVIIKAGQEIGQPFELWKWIVVAALLLVLLEWYIYNRRVYI